VIQQVNRATADLLGIGLDRLIGKPLAAYVSAWPAPKAFFSVLSRLRREACETHEYEELFQARSGRTVRAHVTVSAVRGPTGAVAGLQWIVQERSEAESPPSAHARLPRPALSASDHGHPGGSTSARRRRLAQAQGAEASVGPAHRLLLRDRPTRRREDTEHAHAHRDMVALIGHELMNPLNGILLQAELLKMLGAYRETSVDAILASVRHEKRLIEDLLDLARADATHLRIQPTYADLLPLLQSCLAMCRDGTTTHILRLDAPDAVPYGHWDQGRIQQVFRNLLANAVKYSPRGGEIHVRVRDLRDRVQVTVVDEGMGIAPDALPRVFERYFRVESAGEHRPGLGLGLYIARMLVEAHGGTIAARSAVGRGSVFRVTLPYDPPFDEDGSAGSGHLDNGRL
jgi:PAS domain S-box-containing protein